ASSQRERRLRGLLLCRSMRGRAQVSLLRTDQRSLQGRSGVLAGVGEREGAGRPPGLTDEKARVQRILKNQVPDPVVEFAVECAFNLSGEPKKKSAEPTTEMIAVPVTNLINYYFPNLNLSPLLQVWFDLGIGVKNLVVSRVQAMKVKAAEAPPESPESAGPGDEQKT
ncbi:hypothetical protein LCGC14_2855570, partial [marine sediment metagenome]